MYPDQEMQTREAGIGTNQLDEKARTYSYRSANLFATYEDNFGGHHLTAVAGGNYETEHSQYLEAIAYYLISDKLNDARSSLGLLPLRLTRLENQRRAFLRPGQALCQQSQTESLHRLPGQSGRG